MQRLFGFKPKQKGSPPPPPPPPPPPHPKQAPLKAPSLDQQRKRLQTRIRDISETLSIIDKDLKQLYPKTKTARGTSKQMYRQRCAMLIKKRKQYQGQLKTYMSQQYTLDHVAFSKQAMQGNMEINAALKNAVGVQQKIYEDIDLDKMDDLKGEMEELAAETEYMNQMFNNFDTGVDQEDLEEEMRALEMEYRDQIKNKPQVQQPQLIPQVPQVQQQQKNIYKNPN